MVLNASQFLRARCGRALLTLIVLLVPWGGACGDESGSSFWLPGVYPGFIAVPPTTGFTMPVTSYYDTGTAGAGQKFQHGISVNEGLSAQAAVMFFTPTWAPAGEKWFGGQPSFSLTFGGGWEKVDASVSLSTADNTKTFDRSDTLWGGLDLFPAAQIAWNNGNNNWMSYIVGDIPTGAYQADRLADLGLGHTAVDVGGAYTYLNLKTGTEASALLGFTYNGMNTHTYIQSGWDSHLDFNVSQFFNQHINVGIYGYLYYQLTPDSGAGNLVGAFKSRVAGAGPGVGYMFTVFGQPAYVNLRGYWEFWAQNRLEGRAAYLSLSIPLYPRSENTSAAPATPPQGGHR